jgi:hypothetical protein
VKKSMQKISGFLVAAMIGVILSAGAMFAQKTIAQSASSVFTGSCGMLINRNFGGWEAHYLGDNTIAQNFVGIFNFDTKKMNISYTVVSDFGQSGAVASSATATDVDFTISDGPFAGSYYLGSGGKTFTIVPVNGGNTFLFVENNDQAVATGMCQKI